MSSLSVSRIIDRCQEVARGRFLVGIFLLLTFRSLAILIIPPGGDEVAQLYIADDIAHLTRLPIYFYQQAIMGTLESYVIAPFFRLFGFSFLGGRLDYSLFYFAFMGIYLWIVGRLFSRELTGYLFILLSILPFPALFFTTVMGWTEIPLLAIMSLAFLVRMAEAKEGSFWFSLGLGFISGIALWSNPLFVIWLVPIGISIVGLLPESGRRRIPLGFFFGLLIGLAPVWIHGLQTGTLMSVKHNAGEGFVSPRDLPRMIYLFFARMKYFFSTFSFGSISPWVDGMIRWLSVVPLSLFLFSFTLLTFSYFRSYRALHPKQRVFYNFMIGPPFLLGILYCSRNLLVRDEGMRFLVQLLIPYVFAVSWQLERLRSKVWKRGLLSLLIGILIFGNLFSGREMIRRGSELHELVRFLEKEGLHFGIADIGTAYPLNALSRHRIITTPLPHHAVSKSIWERVKAQGPRFLILERGNPQLRNDLEKDLNLQKRAVGNYDVFYGESDYLKRLLDTQDPILG